MKKIFSPKNYHKKVTNFFTIILCLLIGQNLLFADNFSSKVSASIINSEDTLLDDGSFKNPSNAHSGFVCEITCPNDIVMPLNDSGFCDSIFVNVPLPTINADCIGGVPQIINLTSGQVPLNIAPQTGLFTLGVTNFSIGSAPTTTIEDVVITGIWNSDNGSTSERPNFTLEGTFLGVLPSGGGDCTENAFTFTIPIALYNAVAADGVLDFEVGANGAVNSFCSIDYIDINLDVITGTDLLSYINDFNGQEDASGVYPIGVTTVTYCTLDGFGNEICCSFTVTLLDPVAPLISCPSDIIENCDSICPPLNPSLSLVEVSLTEVEFMALGGTITENCTIASLTYIDTETGVCPIVVTRTFTVTDNSGNTSTCAQTINVFDNTPPVFICPPMINENDDLANQPPYANLAVFQAAGGIASSDVTSFSLDSEVSDGATCPETITRIYTVSDDCGNISTCEQLLVLTNPTPLVITCPNDIVVPIVPGACDGGFINIPLPTINDACFMDVPQIINLASGQVPLNITPQTDLFSLGVTNFSIDGAPIITTADVIITGVWNSDNGSSSERPSFTLEGTLLGLLPSGGGDCSENAFTFTIPIALYNVVAADGVLDFEVGANSSVNSFCSIDYIDINLAVTTGTELLPYINDFNGTADASGVYPIGVTTVNYCAIDAFGNEVCCSFTVTILDPDPLVITCPNDIVIPLDPGACGGGYINIPLPTINNTCVTEVPAIITLSSGQVPLNIAPQTGLSSLGVTNFSIDGAPTITTADVIITGVWNSNNNFSSDNPTFTLEGTLLGNLPPGGADCSENAFTFTIPIAVYNIAAADGVLDFEVGADFNVGSFCDIDYIDLNLEVLSGTELLSYVNDFNGTEDASGIYPIGITTVNYCALDVFGNEVCCSFTVTILEPDPLVINCPNDIVMALDAGDCNSSFINVPLPTINNTCVTQVLPIVNLSSGQVPLNVAPQTGSFSLGVTNFTIFGAPTTTTADVIITGVWNSDNGNTSENPTFSLEGTILGFLPTGGSDCNENAISFTIPIALYNTVAADGVLDFEVGADSSVGSFCSIDYIDINLEVLAGAELLSFVNDFNGTADASGIYPVGVTTVTYCALDVFENEICCSFNVTILDPVAPLISCPSDLTEDCGTACPPLSPPLSLINTTITETEFISLGGTITENCSIASLTYIDTEVGICPVVVTRIFTVTDDSGNTNTCAQTINVFDNTPPEIVCPPTINDSFPITNQPPYPDLATFLAAGGTASNDAISFSLDSEVTDGATCNETITRVYAVSDECGNVSTCEQILILTDPRPLVITCPNDIIMSIDPGACDAGFVNIPLPTLNDACVTSVPQIVNLASGQVPLNIAPQTGSSTLGATFFSIGNAPTATNEDVIITGVWNSDNGASFERATLALELNLIGLLPAGGGDCTENAFTFTIPSALYNIAAVDGVLVFAVGSDSDVDSFCSIDYIDINLEVTTGTEFIPYINDFNGTADASGIYPIGITTVTYCSLDAFGDEICCSFNVTILDNVAPIISCPSDLIENCDTICPPLSPPLSLVDTLLTEAEFLALGGTITENCSIATVSYIDVEVGICPVVITRTFTATDTGGNTGTCAQTINIFDNTPPEIVCPPTIIENVAIGNQPPYANLADFQAAGGIATDAISLSLDSEVSDGATCPETITRVYSVSDECGNISTCEQLLIFTDPTPLVITCPNDIVMPSAPGTCDGGFINIPLPTINNACVSDIPAIVNLSSGQVPLNIAPQTGLSTLGVTDFTITGAPVTTIADVIITGVWNSDNGTIGERPNFRLEGNLLGVLPSGGGDCTENAISFIIPIALYNTVASDGVLDFEVGANSTVNDFCFIDYIDINLEVTTDSELPPYTNDFNGTADASGVYPIGVTTVNYCALDAFGNEVCCNFTVTILDPDPLVITCPNDIVMSVSSDACNSSFINVPLPTINNTCVTGVPAIVNLSSGQVPLNIAPQTGLSSLGVTNFTISGAPTTTTADVIITGVWNSDNGESVERPTFTLEGTQLGFLPSGGGDCTENAISFTIPMALYNTVASDGVLDFEVGADGSVGSFCDVDYIDINLAVITGTELLPYINDFNGTADASGIYPIGVTTVNYCALDGLGNEICCTFTVTILDDVAPLISCPSDILENCGTACLPIMPPLSLIETPLTEDEFLGLGGAIVESCSISSLTYIDTEAGICPTVVTRTFTVTDDSGNTSTCAQTINVFDNTSLEIVCPPTINENFSTSNHPPYANLADFIAAGGMASDAISLSLDSEVSDGGTCPEIITRVYSVSDECGNVSTCEQLLILTDPVPLVITCPNDIVMPIGPNTCNSDFINIPLPTLNNACVTGAPQIVNLSSGQVPLNIAPQTGLSRLGITDFTITGAPTTTIADVIITGVWNSDNGSSVERPTFTLEGTQLGFLPSGGGDCTENAISFIIPIALYNTVAVDGVLDFVVGADNSVDSFCSIDYIDINLEVLTGTELLPYVNDFNGTTDASGIYPVGVTTVTYCSLDAFSNEVCCSFTVTILDNVAPLIVCPNDIIQNCDTICPPLTPPLSLVGSSLTEAEFLTLGGTIIEPCSISNITYVDSETGICPIVVTRIFTVTDDSGNASTCAQTINIFDNTPPEIVCPPTIIENFALSNQPPYSDLAAFVAAGGITLDAISFSLESEITDGATCPEVITRTYSVSDECGNISTCEQLLIFTDPTPPVISCPENITVECGNPTDPTSTGMATATTNCGSIMITSEDNFILNCGITGTIERTWIATDSLGNSSECIQTIIIEDTTPPVFELCPSDVTLGCFEPNDTSILGNAIASDFCPNMMMAMLPSTFDADNGFAGNMFDLTNVGSSPLVISSFDTNVDGAAGQPATFEIYYTFGTFVGAATSPIGWISMGTATTTTAGADMPTPVPIGGLTILPGESYGIYVVLTSFPPTELRYTNGNNTYNDGLLQLSAGIGKGNPVFTGNTFESRTWNGNIHYIAEISPFSSETFEEVSTFGTGCDEFNYSINRTWTAVDNCGNSASCTQVIIVEENNFPIISCPADITIECDQAIDPTITGNATATGDDCSANSEITITFSDESTQLSSDCGNNNYVITRTWVATFICGNATTCEQIINVEDTTPPAIICPADLTIECDDDVSPAMTGMATAIDNCSAENEVVLSFEDVSTQTAIGCEQNSYAITRTWTATDACGNTTTCGQIINVEDTTPPTITCPADLTIECDDDTSPSLTGTATTVDNCSSENEIVISFEDLSTQTATGCEQYFYTITRTWTATDACGNTTTCEQTINVEDTTAPTITCPANVTISCTDSTLPINTGIATSVDNCSATDEITITFSDFSSEQERGCGQFTFNINRTWTATDICGNTATCVQNIISVDNESPVITCLPNDTLDCSMLPPLAVRFASDFISVGGTISDNCTSNLSDFTVTHIDFPLSPSSLDICPGSAVEDRTITRTYTVADACGNVSTCEQLFIYLESMEGPMITSVPSDQTVDCAINAFPQLGLFSAVGDCSKISYNVSDPMVNGSAGCSGSSIEYTYTATDDCGRTVTHVQTYTLSNDGPEFICPVDICVIECPADTETIQAQFDDYASFATVVASCLETSISIDNDFNSTGFISQDCQNPTVAIEGTIAYQIVTFTATDACGWNATCTALVVIKDSDGPVIDGIVSFGLANCGDPDIEGDYTNWATNQLNNLSATDGCFDETVNFSYVPLAPNMDCSTGLASTEVSFIGADGCGNTTILTAFYRIIGSGPSPFISTIPKIKEFTLFQNKPNPFAQETLIGFQLPEATNATLTVFDVAGRVVWTEKKFYKGGVHQVMMDKADLGATGVFYYQLSTSEYSATKKMIVLE